MRLFSILLLGFFVTIGPRVFAEACTYDEAIQALQKGNHIRAVTLLHMAARDGDKRASKLMAELKIPINNQSHPLFSQTQIAAKPDR